MLVPPQLQQEEPRESLYCFSSSQVSPTGSTRGSFFLRRSLTVYFFIDSIPHECAQCAHPTTRIPNSSSSSSSSQKNPGCNISGTESHIIDPLGSKRPGKKNLKSKNQKKNLKNNTSSMHYPIIALMCGSHGLSARRA